MSTASTSRAESLRLDEKTHVENPLLDQLQVLGWKVLRLEMSAPPRATRRRSFDEFLIRDELADALRKLNPFLDDAQVEECIGKITAWRQKACSKTTAKCGSCSRAAPRSR